MAKSLELVKGDFRSLARCITAVENKVPGYEFILEQLPAETNTRVIGITGPPGAGKSTLTDALLTWLLKMNRTVAVLAVDPSSPFHHGALLGDRIRMNNHYNHPDVFIRSLASRGSLGGLPPEIISISDLVCAAGFDYLIIETVGVGQSEIEIAALADTTIVVLVPASGDEIQTMKAGLMEIADIFVVNKSDHLFAAEFLKNLRLFVKSKKNAEWIVPVVKTIATTHEGIGDLFSQIEAHHLYRTGKPELNSRLLAVKAFQLIRSYRMQDVNPEQLQKDIEIASEKSDFNLYQFCKDYSAAAIKKKKISEGS